LPPPPISGVPPSPLSQATSCHAASQQDREGHAGGPQAHTVPPSVSVIIPCYNQGHFLREAIESVVAQTYPHHEIIVVDDASPDMTSHVVRQYPQVRYVKHDRNKGLGASRNTGVRHSSGPFLVFLDADDRLLPHHFETCLRVFSEHPELALVCGDFRWFGAEGTWHRHTCSTEPDQYAALLRFGFITPPHSVMVRREAMTAVGGFKEDRTFEGSEDRDCWLHITRRFPIRCHHQCIAEYRRHPSQMSQQWGLMLSSGIAAMRAQWPYVRGHPVYEKAFRAGVRQYQDACGPPLVWQMVSEARQGRWRRAAASLSILLRFYRQGLLKLIGGKISRVMGKESLPYA